MNLFFESHRELLLQLIRHEVEFILVGGYSVIFHGYHRTTGDLDIWLNPDNFNKLRLILALRQLGIQSESLAAVESLDFQKHVAFHIGDEPEKIDFITRISGISFEEAYPQRVNAQVDDLSIPFLHLDHLILSKMSTGRLKDLADVEELQKVNRFKI